MNYTQKELNMEKCRLIRAYNRHHLTWKELMDAINCLQYDALQIREAA